MTTSGGSSFDPSAKANAAAAAKKAKAEKKEQEKKAVEQAKAKEAAAKEAPKVNKDPKLISDDANKALYAMTSAQVQVKKAAKVKEAQAKREEASRAQVLKWIGEAIQNPKLNTSVANHLKKAGKDYSAGLTQFPDIDDHLAEGDEWDQLEAQFPSDLGFLADVALGRRTI